MRIKAMQTNNNRWDIFPLSGNLSGELIGTADGVSLRYVDICDGVITGEICSVWGLEVTHPMLFNDPKTARGLGLGRGFDMREQISIEAGPGGFHTAEGQQVLAAEAMWTMHGDVQVFNPRLAGNQKEGQQNDM